MGILQNKANYFKEVGSVDIPFKVYLNIHCTKDLRQHVQMLEDTNDERND